MRWSVRHLLGAITVVALVLCARLMLDDIESHKWRFLFAVYFAQLIAVAVIAWNDKGKLRAPLSAYSIFGALYGGYVLRNTGYALELWQLGIVGILISCACALTVGLVLSVRNK